MIAAIYARMVTTESVVRREEQVEPGEGRPDCRQVRRSFGIRGVVVDAHEGALGLSQVNEHKAQEAVGTGLRLRLARGIHGGHRVARPRPPVRRAVVTGRTP
jgi:hypothetical protein